MIVRQDTKHKHATSLKQMIVQDSNEFAHFNFEKMCQECVQQHLYLT